MSIQSDLLLEVPERQELLKMSNWDKEFMTERQLTGKDQRVKAYTLTMGGQEFDNYETNAPKLLEADEGNLGKDNWEEKGYSIQWGEIGAMQEALKRQEERPELGNNQIGAIGMATGVTPEQLEAYRLFKQREDLSDQYDSLLTGQGRLGVQVGETKNSVMARVAQAKDWETSEPARKAEDKKELRSLLEQANAPRIENNQRRQTNMDLNAATKLRLKEEKDERDWADRRAKAERDIDIKKIELENKAKETKYEADLKQWQMKNRQDSIGALVAGLATLGMGFAL